MDMQPLRVWRPLLILALIAIGVVLVPFTPLRDYFTPHGLDRLAGTFWAAPTLVALYLLSFGLGIPGSVLFVAAGFVFDPYTATGLAVLGGTGGSLIAHKIARSLGAEARARWRARRGFAVVERSLDFTGLLTLRFLPFFPHSVVNYGSGILAVSLVAFIPATMIGLAAKAFVYGRLAHAARSAAEAMDFARLDVWGLLIGLTLLSLLARVVVRRRVGDVDLEGEVEGEDHDRSADDLPVGMPQTEPPS